MTNLRRRKKHHHPIRSPLTVSKCMSSPALMRIHHPEKLFPCAECGKQTSLDRLKPNRHSYYITKYVMKGEYVWYHHLVCPACWKPRMGHQKQGPKDKPTLVGPDI